MDHKDRDQAHEFQQMADFYPKEPSDDQRSHHHLRSFSNFSEGNLPDHQLGPQEEQEGQELAMQHQSPPKIEFGLVKKQTTLDGTRRFKKQPTSGFLNGSEALRESIEEESERSQVHEPHKEANPNELEVFQTEEGGNGTSERSRYSEVSLHLKKGLASSDRFVKEKNKLSAASEANSQFTMHSAMTALPKGGSSLVGGASDQKPSEKESSKKFENQELLHQASAGGEKPAAKRSFPTGFTSADDLNNDGKIDRLEAQIKVMSMKDDIRKGVDKAIQHEYISRLKKEVDFHHKVAYRFEKAYKLRRDERRKKAADQEIIMIITEHPEYLVHDEMALFYLLYFCVFYRNGDMLQFVRTLIGKIELADPRAIAQIDSFLELLDLYGMETLRKVGHKVNEEVFHRVLFQAFDDKLSIVYSEIIKALKFLQLRDCDGLELLNTRNYALIKMCLDKYCCRAVFSFDQVPVPSNSIATSYRQYNSAYFEEIILRYKVEERVAQNFRERFLIEKIQIHQVLTMYTKNDYLEHFLRVDVDKLSGEQIAELLLLAIREDSFMIAIQLYLKHVPSYLLDSAFRDTVIESLLTSISNYEYKLFFIHEHFDELQIQQLNKMIDHLLVVLFRRDLRFNPLMNQANPIKISLLIHRVCWKIEQKRIYSLITKCEVINRYIFQSLDRLLEEQRNISYLHRLMLEPVLTLREKEGDILDMMLDMNMQDILNHPVIIEVLNLVNEGQQSVDSPILYLLTSIETLFEVKTLNSKPVSESILKNVTRFGSGSERKQTGLHFHIWKNCLQQRTQDEILFSLLLCGGLLYYFYWVNDIQDQVVANMTKGFTDFIGKSTFVWRQADPAFLENRCQFFATGDCVLIDLAIMVDRTAWISHLIWIASLSTLLQNLIVLRVAKNSVLSLQDFWINVAVLASTSFYLSQWHKGNRNDLITDYCHDNKLSYFTPFYTMKMGQGLYFASDFGSPLGLQFRLTLAGLTFMIKCIKLLEKTEVMGYLIMMIKKTLEELSKFMSTFGALFLVYILAFRMMQGDFLTNNMEIHQISKFALDSLNGKIRSSYTTDAGSLVMVVFTSIASFGLMGFLTTMLVVRYLRFSRLIEAEKRSVIITVKNRSSNIPVFGAITTSYFPLNIFLLPFYLPLILIRSERVNDFAMKVQYFFLVFGYAVLGILASVTGFFLLYAKLIINEGYVAYASKHQGFLGERIIRPVAVVVLGPFLILASLFVDFLSLNMTLSKDLKYLELKYQAIDYYKDVDRVKVSQTLFRIFILNRRPGMNITELKLTQKHQRLFQIVKNFHSFFCRGDQSYKEASQNIKIFNLSKTMGSICSIPSEIGIKRHNVIEFDLIANILNDLALFNFYHSQLSAHKVGETLSNSELVDIGQAFDDFNQAKYQRQKSLPRDTTDCFNTLCINLMARAFSNIEEEIDAFREETSYYRSKKVATQMSKQLDGWREDMITQFDEALGSLQEQLERFDSDCGATMWKMKTSRRMNSRGDFYGLFVGHMTKPRGSFLTQSVINEEEGMPRQISQQMGPIQVTVDQTF